MEDTNHVVVNAKEHGRFECLHCGDTFMPEYPIPVSGISEVINEFLEKHRGCTATTVSRVLTFTGSSDDGVIVESAVMRDGKIVGTNTEEYPVSFSRDSVDVAKFNIGNKMVIYAIYDGIWAFAVGQWDEEIPLPDWPVHILGSQGYSTVLQVTVPAGMPLKLES